MLKHVNIVLLLAAVALTAVSQVRHVTTVNPMSPNRTAYDAIEVYEFDYVDVQPQFPGGEHGLINFINRTREYPYHAYHKHIQGRVLCSFIVGTDGKLYNIQVIRSSGNDSLDREALRVISKMPRWSVGKIDNTKVNVRCVLPIAFRL